MSTDHDTDRPADQPQDESLEDLRSRQAARVAEFTVDDEANRDEDLELPGADLSHEELIIDVLPPQPDEFTCARCFLLHHRSQRVGDVCSDCA